MRYFVYCRKSSDREDRQILGPEAQKRLLLEYADRHHLNVERIYVEHQTAYKVGRPLLNEMLERLEKNRPMKDLDSKVLDYVSSHPPTPERIQRLREP